MKKHIKGIIKYIYSFFQNPQEKRHSLVGPGHLWKMKQNFQINFLKKQGLNKNDKMLDIGCGTLRGGIPFIDYLDKGSYYGIDVRENVLEEGRKELKKNKLKHKSPILLSFSQFTDLKFDIKFDIIFAFSVLIHLDDKIANSCFNFVKENLSEKGIFYANVNIENHKEGSWQGFPVVFRSLDFYKKLAIENGLSTEVIGTLKELGHVSNQELQDNQIMLKFKKVNKL